MKVPGIGAASAGALGRVLLLAALVAAAYAPVRHAGWIWDDDDYVTGNEVLSAPDGLARIWSDPSATPQYYPLVYTTFRIEHDLWGDQPRGYHLVNVALQVLGAILLWRVLVLLRVPGAWIAATVFALHPVNVESVAWVTERKNVLSGVFYFGAAWSWLRWRAPEAEARGPAALLAASFVLFAAALLSKTSTVALPLALLLVVWWKTGRVRGRDVLAVLPLLALSLASGLVTLRVETHHVGAQGTEWSLSPVERLVVAGRAFWFYAGKLLLPLRLSIIHPRWQLHGGAPAQLAWPAAALAVIAALVLLRRRIGRGPAAAALYFAGTLAPVLGFLNVYFFRYSFVADHFQYLASVGPITLAAAGATVALRRTPAAVRVAAASAAFLALGALTYRQASTYHDEESVWRHTLQVNPGAWMAHNNLGLLLVDRGDLAGGLAQYDDAIRNEPEVAEPYVNRGIVELHQGEAEKAVEDFNRALERDPDHVQAWINRAAALAALGRLDEAIRDCSTAIEKSPTSGQAWYNRASLRLQAGDPDAAIPDYAKAIELSPRWADAHKGLADAYYLQGKTQEAINEYSAALRLNPRLHAARNGRAAAFLRLGDVASAISDLQSCQEYGGTPSPQLVAAIRRLTGQ